MSIIEESIERGDAPQNTQRIIDEQGEMRRQAAIVSVKKLQRFSEDFSLWDDLLDMSNMFTFDREDGIRPGAGMLIYDRATAYANALNRPSFTACAYINLWQLNMIRAHSRAFALLNPYWWAIQHHLESYVVDTGHTYSVMPKRPKISVPDETLQDVQNIIDETCEANDWAAYQAEKLRRGDRDGEFILRLFREENGDGNRVVVARFIEPRLLWDPPGKTSVDNVWFGIQFKADDYQRAQGYYIRPADYLGTTDQAMNDRWAVMVKAEEIQHRKYNVDLNSPRGIPTSYAIQPRLDQALKTVIAMGKLVGYRAKIALIRKHINATLSTVQAYLGSRYEAKKDGSLRTMRDIPDAAILDTNDQTEYDFPSQHVDTDKIVFAVKVELQAAAAAVGLADFIWADSTGSNYAASMVTEGPMDKTIKGRQMAMVRDDMLVFKAAINLAIEDGRLSADVLKKVQIKANTPQIIGRNRLPETQADQLLVQSAAMSPQTMARRAGLDPEEEAKAQKDHQKEFPPEQELGDRTLPGRQKVTARPFKSEPATSANPQQAKEESSNG